MSNNKEQYLDKPLPSSEEAEKLCLAAVQMDNALAFELFAYVQPEDFYHPLYRRIATAMKHLRDKGMKIDPILIGEELKKDGDIQSIGGIAAIANLTLGLPAFTTIKPHIEIIRKNALTRRMITWCSNNSQALLKQEKDPEEIMAAMMTDLTAMQYSDPEAGQSLVRVAAHVREIFQQWEAGVTSGTSIPTGIPELDGYLRLKGLARGDLTLVGARPSMGKTALLIQILANAARMGFPVLFLSLEMLKEKIVMRMLASMTGIANKSINPYMFQHLPDERAQMYAALDRLTMPIYFDNSLRLPQLIARAEHFIQTKGVQLVVFDYLTLIKGGNENYDRVGAVGDVVTAMKDLATRNNVAVIGAAQFKREVDKLYSRPRMDAFRDSGVIEQAADVMLFPWDAAAQMHANQPDLIKDEMWLDLYCEKQRDGERYWTVKLKYDKNAQTFTSPEMGAGDPPFTIMAPPKKSLMDKAEEAYDDYHNRDN